MHNSYVGINTIRIVLVVGSKKVVHVPAVVIKTSKESKYTVKVVDGDT